MTRQAKTRPKTEAPKPDETSRPGANARPGADGTDFVSAMASAWMAACEAWGKATTAATAATAKTAADAAAADPDQIIKPYQEAAVAWLDQAVKSPPILSAMFAPLAAALTGISRRNQMADQWLSWSRQPSSSDMNLALNMLRSIESRLLDLSDRVEDMDDRLKGVEMALGEHESWFTK